MTEISELARPVVLQIPSRHIGKEQRQKEALLKHYTGWGSKQILEQPGIPIRTNGKEGTAKRRFIHLDEFSDWFKNIYSRLETE